MNDSPHCSTDIVHQLEELAQLPVTDVNHLQKSPSFLRFVEACQARYPHIRRGSSSRFSLASALRQLGLACLVGGQGSDLAASTTEIVDGLHAAITSADSRRTYLCPLDMASRFPPISFGPNEVRLFSAAELDQLFDVLHLHRTSRTWSLDSQRFSQFSWLLVSEQALHDDMGPDGRKLPGLFADFTRDFGRIEPYNTGLPAAVEAALFGLLTIPWEDIAAYSDTEWRGFSLPWVYCLDADIFARRFPPPSPDTLSWEPAHDIDADGEEYEYERPFTYPLDFRDEDKVTCLTQGAWDDIVSARQSTLFERPVAHFFIRGFQSDGIDEFLAHISTIEAALGSPVDHDAKRRPRIVGSKQGATRRVCLRISGLLNDANVGRAYANLFALRSDFLHGKPVGNIAGLERRSAREIARKVVCALIGAAVSTPHADRDQFLSALLDRGAQLDQKLSSASTAGGGRSSAGSRRRNERGNRKGE